MRESGKLVLQKHHPSLKLFKIISSKKAGAKEVTTSVFCSEANFLLISSRLDPLSTNKAASKKHKNKNKRLIAPFLRVDKTRQECRRVKIVLISFSLLDRTSEGEGVRHGTEVAFVLLTKVPWVRIQIIERQEYSLVSAYFVYEIE